MKRRFLTLAVALLLGFPCASGVAFAESYPAVDVKAGPISGDTDANSVCPKVCSTLTWDNKWRTTQPNVMSVCGTTAGAEVPVGPIWNDQNAKTQCPAQLSRVNWNRSWHTTEPGKMSVCGCSVVPPTAAAWFYMADDQDYKTIPDYWKKISFKDVDVLYVGPFGIQSDNSFGLYNSSKTGDLANRFNWVLKTARDQNPSIRVIASQWWGNGDGIWGKALSALKDDDAITAYAASVSAFLESHLAVDGGVDGYDIDYESNNVIAKAGLLAEKIQKNITELGRKHDGRRFFLTVSPAQTQYLSAAAPFLDFVNMQTYAGGSGITPQDFTGMGLKAQQLLYGICPESNCSTPSVETVEAAYTKNNLAGIHLWRLNSDNYAHEDEVQAKIYKFLHP